MSARYVLFVFASTQLISALFTPRPLLSLGLAAARTLFILAMISAGVYLRDSRNLRPLLWGHLVIFATAWAYTLSTQGVAGVQARMGHPYYYVVSLGLVAVVSLWLVVFWRGGPLWWRVPAGILALATFLAAGSRGPLLALGVGTLAALIVSGRKRRWVLVTALGLVALVAGLKALNIPLDPINRLMSEQLSGRELVWGDALAGWLSHLWGGVGAYQGGPYLTSLYADGCLLTPTLDRNEVLCPAWLSTFSSAWLIAHNALLHWLLETGLIGSLGLLTVSGYSAWMVIRSQDPLLAAIFFGYTAMNVVDVVIAVPSPHFTELWWVVVGTAYAANLGQKAAVDK